MTEINLVNTTQKTPLAGSDRLAVWPDVVDEQSDLQYLRLTDIVGYVTANGSFIDTSIVSYKGDLLVGASAGSLTTVPVGANNRVLIADNTQTAGVNWGTVSTDGITNYAVTPEKVKSLQVSSLSGTNVTLDFTGAGLLTHDLTGSTTYNVDTLTYGPGRTLTIKITTTSTRLLYFPNDWVFVGIKPTAILANKTGILSVTSFGTTAAECVAAWAVST
jgi:hypothetical protein